MRFILLQRMIELDLDDIVQSIILIIQERRILYQV